MSKEFFYTQTSVKDLEKEETCPTRWKAQWLDGLIPFKTNEDLDKGNYFEGVALGSGATDKVVSDLPRLKTGEKSVDQQRIEAQAARCKRILFDPTDILNAPPAPHTNSSPNSNNQAFRYATCSWFSVGSCFKKFIGILLALNGLAPVLKKMA